jgi:branched-subunit amino acid aminotransferase/4-amino-4-deoxychorismate lyase
MEVHSAVLELLHVDRHIDRLTDSRKYMAMLIGAFLLVFIANAKKTTASDVWVPKLYLFP